MMDEPETKARNRTSLKDSSRPASELASELELLNVGQVRSALSEETAPRANPPIRIARNGLLWKIIIAIVVVASIISLLIMCALVLSNQRQENPDTGMTWESLELRRSSGRTLTVRVFTLPRLRERLRWLPDILLFTGIEWSIFNELIGGILIAANSSEVIRSGIITSQFIILDHTSHFHKICEKTAKSVHLLSYEGQQSNGGFRWMRSRGSTHQLRSTSETDKRVTISEAQLLEDLMSEDDAKHVGRRQPVCIDNNPGKSSIFSTRLWRKLSKKFPHRNIRMVEASYFLKKFEELNSTDVVGAVTHVLRNELGVSENIKTELMLEEVDKVVGSDRDVYTSKHELNLELLKIIISSFPSLRLWVSLSKVESERTSEYVWSRPRSNLEDVMDVLCYSLTKMSMDDQISYMVSAWAGGSSQEKLNLTKLVHFASECLNVLASTPKPTGDDPAHTTLLLQLLAETYAEEAVQFAQLERDQNVPSDAEKSPRITLNSTVDLYENLIQNKFKNYLDRNPNLDENQLLHMHIRLSLQSIFPGKFPEVENSLGEIDTAEIQKVGLQVIGLSNIIHVGSSTFFHESVAEYFLTRFLVDQLVPYQDMTWNGTNLLDLLVNETLDRESKYEVVYEPPKEEEAVSGVIFDSFQFTHHRMGYMLDHLLSNIYSSTLVNGSFLSKPTKGVPQVSPAVLEEIARACINANFIHLFSFLDQLGAFQRNSSVLYDEFFLFYAIDKTSSEFAKLLLTRAVEEYPDFVSEHWPKLLRSAAASGRFSLMEHLLLELDPSWVVVNETEGTHWLLHDCLRDSIGNSGTVIKEKIKLLRLLVRVDATLLGVRYGSYPSPLFSHDAHPRLIIELVRLGADVLVRDKFRDQTIAHKLDLFNPEEYHSLLMSIPKDKLKQLVLHHDDEWHHALLYSLIESKDPIPSTLEFFKSTGADFNYMDRHGVSVLASAVQNGRNMTTIKKLIACGSDIKWKGRQGETLMHIAADAGNAKLVNFLAKDHSFGVSGKDALGRRPLWYAITCMYMPGDRYETAMNLYNLDRNGSRTLIDTRDAMRRSPLHESVIKGITTSISLLPQFGSNPNLQDKNGDTPLHLVFREHRTNAAKNDFAMTALLYDNKADPNILNKNGKTPFHLALKYNKLDFETFQLLKSTTVLDWTPPLATLALVTVIRTGSGDEFPRLFQEFEDIGADIFYLDDESNSLLHLSAQHCNFQGVRLLVEQKLSVLGRPNKRGATPLHKAAGCRNKDIGLRIIKYLIDNGTDVDVYSKTRDGNNFLHLFINGNDVRPTFPQFYSLTQYLVANSHEDLFNITDSKGNSGFTLAMSKVRSPWVKIRNLLLSIGMGEDEPERYLTGLADSVKKG